MRERQISTNTQLQHVSNITKAMQIPPGFACTSLMPEGPAMRSATLASPTSDMNPHLKRYTPILRPPPLSKTAPPSLHLVDSQDLDFNLKKNVTQFKVPCSNWLVRNEALTHVPDHFLLEKTSRFISGTNASTVSARISECLCSRSIEVVYHDTKAKAKCRNSDYVKFQIRLYSGRGEYKHGVIVEVQRRSGSCLSFMKDCHAILNAAEGDYGDDSLLPKLTPVQDLKCLQNAHVPQETESFKKALELLMEDRLDANVLGMDYLSSLTDSTKSSEDVVVEVAKNILNGASLKVLEKIVHSIHYNYNAVEEDDLPSEAHFYQKLRNHAMNVLLNLIRISSELDSGLFLKIKNHPSLMDDFLNILINDLKDAQQRPHDAFAAAKSLALILEISSVHDKVRKEDCIIALNKAKNHGSKYHLSLASESLKILHALKCH